MGRKKTTINSEETNKETCKLCLKYGKEPNETTKKAIEEAQKGKGFHRVTSVEDLFKQLSE